MKTAEKECYRANGLITTVFVEKPLALPWVAKKTLVLTLYLTTKVSLPNLNNANAIFKKYTIYSKYFYFPPIFLSAHFKPPIEYNPWPSLPLVNWFPALLLLVPWPLSEYRWEKGEVIIEWVKEVKKMFNLLFLHLLLSHDMN